MTKEQRLEASMTEERRYRLMVDAITDYAVYMLDPSGIVSSWNSGARRFKGYEASEIVGRHFSCFYIDEDRASGLPQRALREASEKGKFESEGWRMRKDGTRFWAYVIIDPIWDESGELLGYAKITRDLTERKQSERALEQAREALFQSQKMEAVGRLTGGVAHDFNNLLMVVLGSLELLRKRIPDDPKLMALVENAIQGAKRGASLTQRMLAFARRQQLNFEPVDVRTMVQGMATLLQRSLGPETVIDTHFPLNLSSVRTDMNQLEAALLNLVVNARDAMPDGGHIIISAREETVHEGDGAGLNPGAYVCLAVQDNGTGMDEEALAHATEPFFTTKGPGKGTGLGLSMVHGLATQSGGRLVLKSRKGEGTRVEMWFPAVAASEPEASQKTESALPVYVRPLRVLVVDDDMLVLNSTSAMLEDLGHSVVMADDGINALGILARRNDIDLMITDFAMPGMTGAQLAQAARERLPDIPVVLATGYAELPSGIAQSLPKILKPFSQQQLAKTLSDVFGDDALTPA